MKRTAILKRSTPLKSGGILKRSGKAKDQAKPARMKSTQRTVTPAEKSIWSKLAALGCVACRKDGSYNPHVSIHHVDGRTKHGCHMLVLPLCGSHHQDDGSGAIAVHPWKARFEERYGNQLELVAECMALIGEGKQGEAQRMAVQSASDITT